jgi:hypothetical protein
MLSIRYICFHAKLTQTTPAVVNLRGKHRKIATEVVRLLASRFYVFPCPDREERLVATSPVLPDSYVVSTSRIPDRRMILAGYRLADLLTRIVEN